MAAPIDAAWDNNVVSDTNLNATTYGQGTSFPSTFPANRLFLRTDTNVMWQNTGTLGTPAWTQVGSSGGQSADMIYPLSTTIADYSQPSAATASSAAGGDTPDYTFDFSSSTGWTFNANGGSSSITGGILRLTADSANDYPTAFYDLGSNLNNTVGWVMRFKIILNAFTNNAPGNGVAFSIGMSDSNTNSDYSAENPSSTIDAITFQIAAHAATSETQMYSNSYTNTYERADGTLRAEPLTATRWIEIIYNAATPSNTIKVYTDSGFTTLEETITKTLSSNSYFSDMRYIFSRFHYQGVSDSNTVDIDDLQIYNNKTSVTTATANTAIDNNTATKWQSSQEVNPWIYVDLASARDIAGVALNVDKTLTTETQIKIQTSTDASTWTTRRTINISDFTDDTWRYLMINRLQSDARYVRVYGNSGTSYVLSINEIKVSYSPTTTDWNRKHYHKYLDSTSTSANTLDSN